MSRNKRLIAFFIYVFIISSFISFFALTHSKSLTDYDGSDLRRIAVSQLGNKGGEKYWRWYGFESRQDWCACFVSWCLASCYKDCPKFASCSEFVSWFKSINCWYDRDSVPDSGMIILFDWDCDDSPDHIGIVDCVKDDRIYVIEGNSKDMCARRDYALKDPVIAGYGAVL